MVRRRGRVPSNALGLVWIKAAGKLPLVAELRSGGTVSRAI